MRSGRRLGAARLAGFLALVVSGPAFSQGGPQWTSSTALLLRETAVGRVAAETAGDFNRLINQRTVGSGATAGAVLMRDLLNGPGPATSIALGVNRVVPWAALAKGIGRALPVVGTALAVADLLNGVRCKGGNEWSCDDGQPEQEVPVFTCTTASPVLSATATSPVSACAGIMESKARANYADPYYGTQAIQKWTVGSNFSCAGPGPYANSGACSRNWFTAQGSQFITSAWVKATSLQCPTYTVNGVATVGVKGADGLCPTGTFTPAPGAEIEAKTTSFGDKAKAVAAVAALEAAGVALDHDVPVIDGPTSISGPRTIIENPDGSKRVIDVDYPLSYNPNGSPGYRWDERARATVYPPGVQPSPWPEPGTPILGPPPPGTGGTGGGTTTAPPTAPVQFKTCGLPDTPPCKIDEGGTPPPPASWGLGDPVAEAAPLRAIIDNPPRANTSWSWSFALPSACSVIAVGTFAGRAVAIDLCAYQPMIHDIMSMVWALSTVFACVTLVGRTLTSS